MASLQLKELHGGSEHDVRRVPTECAPRRLGLYEPQRFRLNNSDKQHAGTSITEGEQARGKTQDSQASVAGATRQVAIAASYGNSTGSDGPSAATAEVVGLDQGRGLLR
ncbi:hypothetical protein GCM10027430_24980 [Lysobacter tyrosinilyticus]